MFKTTLILMQLGALLGIAVASWVVPPAVSWYAEPAGLPGGAQIQAIVQIPEVMRYATNKLIYWQTVAAVIGAAAGLAAGVMLRPKAKASAQTTDVQ